MEEDALYIETTDQGLLKIEYNIYIAAKEARTYER